MQRESALVLLRRPRHDAEAQLLHHGTPGWVPPRRAVVTSSPEVRGTALLRRVSAAHRPYVHGRWVGGAPRVLRLSETEPAGLASDRDRARAGHRRGRGVAPPVSLHAGR